MDTELEKSVFKFTEKILYGYKDIDEFINNTEEKLKLMEQEELITTVGSINYDSIQVSPTFNIGRVTELKALGRVEEEIELKIELYRNKKLKKEIFQLFQRWVQEINLTQRVLKLLIYIRQVYAHLQK